MIVFATFSAYTLNSEMSTGTERIPPFDSDRRYIWKASVVNDHALFESCWRKSLDTSMRSKCSVPLCNSENALPFRSTIPVVPCSPGSTAWSRSRTIRKTSPGCSSATPEAAPLRALSTIFIPPLVPTSRTRGCCRIS